MVVHVSNRAVAVLGGVFVALAMSIVLSACGDDKSKTRTTKVNGVDTDGETVPDKLDDDDDDDGVVDELDAFPTDATESTDTDGDGIGDNADIDDDADGVADEDDVFPLDPDEYRDTDGDGYTTHCTNSGHD